MYNINDYIIYRNEVCKIKEIKTNKINNKDYYVLVPLNDESLIIDTPVDNKLGKIRKIISKEEVENIIKEIPNIDTIECPNDKMYEIEYKRLLEEGSHESLIKIIKTTYLRNKNRIDSKRKISDKDDKYFKKSEELLYSEFSVSLNISYDEAKNYVIKSVESINK